MSTRVHSLVLVPSDKGVSPQLRSSWPQSLSEAAQAWSYPQIPCTSVNIKVDPPSHEWLARQDGINLIVFRNKTWCHNERCGRTTVFPSTAVAMTTVYPEGARFQLVTEADIEINARWFHEPMAKLDPSELRTILVHEIGHVLGLEDKCSATHATSKADWSTCSESERSSVMFAPAKHPMPSALDIEALCKLYPQNSSQLATGGTKQTANSVENPSVPKPTGSCKCDMVGDGTSGMISLIVVGTLMAVRAATTKRRLIRR